MKKIVSIVIPAYNVEKYIKRCITSCCNQTYDNIEIIIIDDGSTDNTWNIIKQLKQTDQRIKCLTQANKGVAETRNKGLATAIGDYIVFLDSDDWLENDTIAFLVDKVKSSTSLVCCDCFYAFGEIGKEIKTDQSKNNSFESLSKYDLMKLIGKSNKFRLASSCYKLFDAKIIKDNNINFTCGIVQGEDGLFTYKYLCHIEEATYYPKPLWNIYDRPGSACNSPYNSKWKTSIDAINEMISYNSDLPDDIKDILLAYKSERAMWLQKSCLLTNSYDNKELLYYREILRKYGKYLIKREKNLKTIIQYMIYTLFPTFCTKVIIRLLNG